MDVLSLLLFSTFSLPAWEDAHFVVFGAFLPAWQATHPAG